MKTKLYLLFFLGLAILGCEEIPDLNPNTNAGADISVFEINETLVYASESENIIETITTNYDLNEDGIDDIVFDYRPLSAISPAGDNAGFSIEVNGELLLKNQAYPELSILNSNNSFNAFNTVWKDAKPNIINGYCYFRYLQPCLETINNAAIPTGNKYIMMKLFVNGALHHGWINYTLDWSYDEETNWPNGAFIVNSIGVANQPGVVLRAGQTN